MKLSELAQKLGGELLGDGSVEVASVASIETAQPGTIVRVDAPAYLENAEKTKAAAFLVGKGVETCSRPAIRVPNARLAFAKALELFAPAETKQTGIHPTAVVQGAKLGEGCTVGAYAVLEEGVELGNRVTIHPHVTVGWGTKIGEDSVIFPNVSIYPRTQIGRRVRIHSGSVIGADGYAYEWDGTKHAKITSIGHAVLMDDVEIGALSAVDRATVGATIVGPGTKIDNFVQVAHNVQVGAHCLLVCMVGIAGSAKIGNGVVMMGGACAKDHVTVGDRVRVGLRSEVWSDIPANTGDWSGKPARPHREDLKSLAALHKLPEILRQLKRD